MRSYPPSRRDRLGRLLCAGLILAAGAVGRAAPPTTGPATQRENLERAFALIDRAAADVPADTFDPVSVVKSIGNKPDELFAWVRDNTRWLPYRGALRGPVGVLMDRGGDSLDRSLLLAEFYAHTAGVTVRLAHATLTAEQARGLYDKLKAAPRPKPVAFEPGDGVGTAGQAAAQQLDRLGEDLTARAAALSASLPAIAVPKEDVAAAALDAVADHWWLQRSQAGGWVDLDVTLPGAMPGEAVCPATTTMPFAGGAGPVPADRWHTVRLAVVAERWADGKLSQATVLSRTVRPGGVVGSTIYLTHVPVDWATDPTTGDTAEAVARARKQALVPTEWVPTLRVGVETASDGGVRPDGSINPKPQQDTTARLGGGTNKAVGAAAGALDSAFGGTAPPAAAPPAGVFTAEWLDYTIHTPGSPDRTIRREVFDLIGPAARAAGMAARPTPDELSRANAALSLAGRVDVVVLPCQPSPAFVGHALMQSLALAKGPLLAAVTAVGTAGGAEATADAPPPCPAPLYGYALARRLFSPSAADWFVGRANVVALHSFARLTADGRQAYCEATDVVADDVAIDPWSTADPAKVRRQQGILDAAAEGAFLPANGTRTSAAGTLAAAAARAVPPVTVRTPADLARLTLPADVAARVAAELSAGRVVVLPAAAVPVDGQDRYAWWSVDPATGQPLAIGDRGWGQDMGEYTAMILRFLMAHKRLVCLGAATATVANTLSPLFNLNELNGDALSVLQTALDAACGAAAV